MNNNEKIILHLCCSKYASDSEPYRNAGYDVRLIGKEIGVENYEPPENVYGIIANPPCTEFSILNRMKQRKQNQEIGMILVKECLRVIWKCELQQHLKFWFIENPATGTLRNFLGKPAYEYQPWEFGEDRSKRTALWGIFNNPPKLILQSGSKSKNSIGHKTEKTKHDTDSRSICCPQFAQAFFIANP